MSIHCIYRKKETHLAPVSKVKVDYDSILQFRGLQIFEITNTDCDISIQCSVIHACNNVIRDNK